MKPINIATSILVAALLSAAPAIAAKSENPAAKALILEGATALASQDLNAAILKFYAAAKLKPSGEAYYLLGYAHYLRGFKNGGPETADKQDVLAAIVSYNNALDSDPGLKTVMEPARLYQSWGLCYEAIEAYEKAASAYRLALQAAPGSPMILLDAARLSYRIGDTPRSTANLVLSLRKAKLIRQDDSIIKTVKSPQFSALLAAPQNAAIIRDAELALQRAAYQAALADAATRANPEEMRDALNDFAPSGNPTQKARAPARR